MRCLVWLALTLAPLGCNAILGIEDRVEVLCEEGSQCPGGFCSADFACDDTQWVRRFGGEGDDEAFDLLHFDEDREGPQPGTTIVVGSFEGDAEFGDGQVLTSDGGKDAFVLALNERGQTRWVRQFAGPGDQVAIAVDADADGNLYVAGTLEGDSRFGALVVESASDLYGGFVAKLDDDGRTDWVAPFGATAALTIRDVEFIDTAVTTVGDYDGTFVNAPQIPPVDRPAAFGLTLTTTGQYAAGFGLPTTQTSSSCCVKMSDAYGIPVLAGALSGTILGTDPPIAATEGTDGWFTRPTAAPDGTPAFEIGTSTSPITAIAPVGTRIVTAHTLEQSAVLPVPQLAVVRFDYLDASDGQIVRADDPEERGEVVSLLTNDRDETYAFGQFEGELRFDDGPGFDTRNQSVFVAVMDSQFLLPSGRTRAFSGEGDATAAGMALDAGGNILLGGSFARTFELTNDFGTPMVESSGGRDIYVAALRL